MNEIHSKLIKIIGIVFIVIVVLNIILVAAGIMSWSFFWIIIIIAAFVAYLVIPWLKKEY